MYGIDVKGVFTTQTLRDDNVLVGMVVFWTDVTGPLGLNVRRELFLYRLLWREMMSNCLVKMLLPEQRQMILPFFLSAFLTGRLKVQIQLVYYRAVDGYKE